MKTHIEQLIPGLVRKVLLGMAVLVTLCIAVDSALHTSHVLVFFSLIILSVLFYSLYIGSQKHSLAVSITCLVLGSIYLAFYRIGFDWWRFLAYSATFYISGILLLASWLLARHWHHSH